MNPFVFDLAEVTKTTDIDIDGHTLWVRPGVAGGGRFWQFLTKSDMRVGMVVEQDGALVAVFESAATDAVRRIVADLCDRGLGGAS